MTTFADIQIGAAMSHPDHELILQVTRVGSATPLQFQLDPIKDTNSGLRSFGVTPARSGTLADQIEIAPVIENMLIKSGLSAAGVKPGSTLTAINGVPITNAESLYLAFEKSNGQPVSTTWSLAPNSTLLLSATTTTTAPALVATAPLSPEPKFEKLFSPDS